MVHKAFKFRIYPTKEQEIFIAKTLGCCRYVYNRYLHQNPSATRPGVPCKGWLPTKPPGMEKS